MRNPRQFAQLSVIRRLLAFTISIVLGCGSYNVSATPLGLSDLPLEVKEGVPANIILTMDDSGSMAWAYLPDDRWGYRFTNRFRSSTFNSMYYDPNTTYLPGVDQNGNSLGNASFTNAWINGYVHSIGTVNLANNYRVTVEDYRPTSNWSYYVGPGGGEPAHYYVFDSTLTTGGVSCNINNTAHVDDDNCYRRVVVSATSGRSRYSPETTGCIPVSQTNTACYTGPDERQNFANWYSYYRIRHLLAKTATTRAFSGLSTSVRVSWQTLNALTSVANPLPFGGAHRAAFFNWLYTAPTSGWTPLPDAFWRAGVKYSQAAAYRKDPNNSASPEYSCRQNFHFAFTDGYWNVNNNSAGNYDAQNHTLPTTGNSKYGDINYQANSGSSSSNRTPPIYRDGNSNNLADIALYFWAHDLRSSLQNDVPHFITDNSTDIDGDSDSDNYDIFWNPNNDPAEWQHMVNFTVGLGIDGSLAYNNTTYQALLDGSQHWNGNHVDDLWHAAINSRGRYFSASNPQELLDGFQGVLDSIDERKGSSSSVATTSSQYQAGTLMFQAIYDPSKWSGDVEAKDVITLNPQWSAATRLKALLQSGTARNIITNSPTSGPIPFLWSVLDTSQQNALDTLNGVTDGKGSLRLDWLRGDDSQEIRNGGSFRNRTSPLGDIVHSDPVFVPPPGPPLYFYPDNLETAAYSSFASTYANRTKMLLFGANDGMLHILDASNGNELLSYVPSMLFNKLSKLTDPAYRHEFYIDQPVSVWDVFFNGDWHTVAIGGLGKGGQGLYALDITNPAAFAESNAANLVLWEFSDADDADLGYSYTRPYIMRMNNGKWMVAFGNGYNSMEPDANPSSTGDAILYLLDVEHGGKGASGIFRKISTTVGAAEDPTGNGRANRLSDITAVDVNHDYMVDFIYAGDLFGNLWKFDVRDPDPNNWDVYKQGNTPTPLFVARDPSGNPQPITMAPAVQYHQKKHGFMVFVGTGKYVEDSDPSDLSLQTFYGIWDRQESNINTITRNYLLQQQMLGENNSQFSDNDARLTSNNVLNWYNGSGLPTGNPLNEFLGWYIDLANIDSNGNPILTGERADDHIYVFGNRVEFQTLIPSTDPCVSGGESWLFALNATTGSRFENTTPWDYNNDGSFSDADKVNFGSGQIWGSGIRKRTGTKMFRTTKLLVPNQCQEINILNMTDGTTDTITGNCTVKEVGRRSWRQIEIN